MTAKELSEKTGVKLWKIYYIADRLGKTPTEEDVLNYKPKRGRPVKYDIDKKDKTAKSGIIVEPNEEYHGYLKAIDKSRLQNLEVCPEYFKWCENNPKQSTPEMIFGSAFHKMILEPKDFRKEFVVEPNIDRRTKQGKEDYQKFLTAIKNKTVIKAEDKEIIKAMKKSLYKNKYVEILLKGDHENSFYFVDDLTNELCKCRPDSYCKMGDRVVIVDLKTCASARTEEFMRVATKLGYDLQAYMYALGVSKVLNVPIENVDFVFIAIEKKPPYLVNILQADQYVMQRGEALFRKYIGLYHYCKETNNWYGLNGEQGMLNSLTLPGYLLKDLEE